MIPLGSTVILKSGVDGRVIGRCEHDAPGGKRIDTYDVRTHERMHIYLSPEFFTVVAEPPEDWSPIVLADLEDDV